jgi:hypothetical protein
MHSSIISCAFLFSFVGHNVSNDSLKFIQQRQNSFQIKKLFKNQFRNTLQKLQKKTEKKNKKKRENSKRAPGRRFGPAGVSTRGPPSSEPEPVSPFPPLLADRWGPAVSTDTVVYLRRKSRAMTTCSNSPPPLSIRRSPARYGARPRL